MKWLIVRTNVTPGGIFVPRIFPRRSELGLGLKDSIFKGSLFQPFFRYWAKVCTALIARAERWLAQSVVIILSSNSNQYTGLQQYNVPPLLFSCQKAIGGFPYNSMACFLGVRTTNRCWRNILARSINRLLLAVDY